MSYSRAVRHNKGVLGMRTDTEAVVYTFMAANRIARENGSRFQLSLSYIESVMERYLEPWRVYHGMRHINEGCGAYLKLLEQSAFDDPLSVLFAWYNHDIVYVPGAPKNEECSAQLLESELKLLLDNSVIRKAAQMVRTTKDHQLPKEFPGAMQDLALLHDIDLAPLGIEHTDYVQAGEGIKQELGIDEDAWVRGRALFAEQFLREHPQIYKTPYFASLEARARNNLEWSVACAKKA